MATQTFTWAINIIFLIVLWMTGNKMRSGWLLGLFLQLLWVMYAITTKQYAFLVAVIPVTIMYSRNWILWGKPEFKEPF